MYFQQCCAIQINQWLIRLHKMIMLLLLISSGILETFKKTQRSKDLNKANDNFPFSKWGCSHNIQ